MYIRKGEQTAWELYLTERGIFHPEVKGGCYATRIDLFLILGRNLPRPAVGNPRVANCKLILEDFLDTPRFYENHAEIVMKIVRLGKRSRTGT